MGEICWPNLCSAIHWNLLVWIYCEDSMHQVQFMIFFSRWLFLQVLFWEYDECVSKSRKILVSDLEWSEISPLFWRFRLNTKMDRKTRIHSFHYLSKEIEWLQKNIMSIFDAQAFFFYWQFFTVWIFLKTCWLQHM